MEKELETALGKLKKGKVGGKTGIPPALIAYGGTELFDRMLELMREMKEERKVVNDWKDAEIVPIPSGTTRSFAFVRKSNGSGK